MNTIPLHQLPDRAFLRVLQLLEIHDQLSYSLCSKNTKKSIKSLQLTVKTINLCVSDYIRIDICSMNSLVFYSFMNIGNLFPNQEFRVPKSVQISVPCRFETTTEWKLESQNFGIKDWLRHFCEVLHHPRIDALFLNEEHITTNFIEPVQKVIKGLHLVYLSLDERLTPWFTRKALESFTHYEKLYVNRIPFDDHEDVKTDKLLFQNVKRICIANAPRIKINQILLSNSEEIQLNISTLTEKDLNLFLKLWSRGSNPSLRFFGTMAPQLGYSYDKNVIIKGIVHSQYPLDSPEVYKRNESENYFNVTKLAGAYRIRKFNGTTALIVVVDGSFKFFVV